MPETPRPLNEATQILNKMVIDQGSLAIHSWIKILHLRERQMVDSVSMNMHLSRIAVLIAAQGTWGQLHPGRSVAVFCL